LAPDTVHDGTWKHTRTRRQDVLDAAYAAHPDRFHCGPAHGPHLPSKVWINKLP
jgi:hypothetical protein